MTSDDVMKCFCENFKACIMTPEKNWKESMNYLRPDQVNVVYYVCLVRGQVLKYYRKALETTTMGLTEHILEEFPHFGL